MYRMAAVSVRKMGSGKSAPFASDKGKTTGGSEIAEFI